VNEPMDTDIPRQSMMSRCSSSTTLVEEPMREEGFIHEDPLDDDYQDLRDLESASQSRLESTFNRGQFQVILTYTIRASSHPSGYRSIRSPLRQPSWSSTHHTHRWLKYNRTCCTCESNSTLNIFILIVSSCWAGQSSAQLRRRHTSYSPCVVTRYLRTRYTVNTSNRYEELVDRVL